MSPKKPTKPRIAANGYRLCDPLPKGEVLTDNTKQEWVLGSAIGSGGFGDIYSCRRRGDRTDDYVIKLDNKTGPLYQEINFYMKCAKEDQINNFMAKHKLRFLGIPRFIASGIHDKSSNVSPNKRNTGKQTAASKRNAPTLEYRFLVMQRFGDQLEDYVIDKRLTAANAADVAAKMIDVLQYVHSFGYIHADIKGTNILKSLSKSKTANDWYLVDFGLAERYCDSSNGRHREEKADKKRANNGTVEFRSRDAHIGQLSRRSDIECLAYNVIQWLYGTLPWMSCLNDAKKVENLKEKFFENLDQSLKKCFRKSVPNGLKKFLEEVDKIDYKSEPKYRHLKDILLKGLSKTKTNKRRDSDGDDEEEEEDNEEVARKASNRSSSESTIDEIQMNSPLKRRNRSSDLSDDSFANKKVNKRKGRVNYVELSDSEDTSVASLNLSPPKRTRVLRKADTNAVNFKTPERKSPRRPVPVFSTPLLFEKTDESDDSPPVIRLSSGGSNSEFERRSNRSATKVDTPYETPAMKEMRQKIEKKKLEQQMKKKRNKK